MKKLWTWFKRFWYGVWQIIKSMGTVRGLLSLTISWLILSGAGVSLIGIIIANNYIIGLGATIFAFWLLPLTPLTVITIGVAMFMQRFIFRDKSISWRNIKSYFADAKAKDKDKVIDDEQKED